MSRRRGCLLVVGVAAVVLLGVAVAAFHALNPEALRGAAERQLTALAGEPVSIGRLSVSLFPVPAVTGRDVRVLSAGVFCPPPRTGPAAHFCRFLTLSGAGSDANVRPDKSACRNNRCAICNIWSRSKGRWRSIADLCEGARRHAGRRARHGGVAGCRAEKRTMLERMRTHITTLVGRYKR